MFRKILIVALLTAFIVSLTVTVMHVAEEEAMAETSTQAREVVRGMVSTYGGGDGVDFDAIRAAFGNDEIVAHLYVHGTNIDYFVVQTSDNDFYLYHDIWKNSSGAGWIFLDYAASLEGGNHNWVIYGHNMQRDHKFHSISRFRDPSFFREHNKITLTLEHGVTEWEIFSFYSSTIAFNYTQPDFPTDEAWAEMLNTFADLSRHMSNVGELTAQDRILTLSTCTNTERDERFVVHARLIS